jgi:hypothetical protein
MRVFLAMRVVFEGIKFYRKYICIKREPVFIADGFFGNEIVVFESVAAFQGNIACLRLPGTGIGRNEGLPGVRGFDGGFKDKAILVKFPHLGFGNSTYLV